MKPLRRALYLAVLTILPAIAGAADKRILLDTGQTFVIKGDSTWVVGANQGETLPGSVTLHGTDLKQWRLVVSPLPPHPSFTGDIGNLRIYVRAMARGLENLGAEVDPEHRSIEGGNAKGLYFQVQDLRKKTKAQVAKAGGDFTHAYLGALNIGSKPYLFEVAWIQGGEAPARAALAAVKTIRFQ